MASWQYSIILWCIKCSKHSRHCPRLDFFEALLMAIAKSHEHKHFRDALKAWHSQGREASQVGLYVLYMESGQFTRERKARADPRCRSRSRFGSIGTVLLVQQAATGVSPRSTAARNAVTASLTTKCISAGSSGIGSASSTTQIAESAYHVSILARNGSSRTPRTCASSSRNCRTLRKRVSRLSNRARRAVKRMLSGRGAGHAISYRV